MKNDFNRCTVHHLNLLKVTRYIQLDAIFHDQIQRIGTLVFVALVNERTEIKR
jgi:hypothetical protein